MDGGTGFDQLVAGTNRDIMYGGADTDYFWFAGITSVGDQVDGGSGYDYILANGSNTSITLFSIVNVEHIHANTYTGVYISGTSAAENLDFSATTLTNIQNIQMLGGDDTVTGSAAADVIYGGDGNDIIAGAGGADILIGGNGSNTFDFNSIAHSSAASADTIWDFWQAASDKIDLLTIDANTGLAGDQAFSFIGLAAFSSVSGQLRYDNTTNPGWTSVFADNNGDSVADFRVDLNGTYTLLSGDFVL